KTGESNFLNGCVSIPEAPTSSSGGNSHMNAMLIVVGLPYAAYIRWEPSINWIPFHDFSSSNILGMVLNVVMLIPFGSFLPIFFTKFRKLLPTVIAGMAMSLVIEILQLFTFGATDVDDLIMNTLGTLLGYFVGAFIARKVYKKEENNKDIIKLVVMVIISILVVVFVNNPLMICILRALGEM
ncbi:MAG: VanZ family protein, partial [Oliverpabstia sp.]